MLKTFLLLAAAAAAPLSGASWVSKGPFGGSAQNIAIDPSDHRILLAGTRSALLYRSEDAGQSWNALPFPHLYHVSIYSVAIDPTQPGLYWIGVAAETRRAGDTSAGLYRSLDAGQTWTQVEGMKGRSVYALAVWPSSNQVIAAGTDEGVWRSLDGGASWSRISAESNSEMQAIMSLAFHPANRDILYAGTPHLPWKTSDGGASWNPVHDGMIDDSDVFSIHVDSSRPDRVFASACSGIYCSRNGGALWSKLQGIPKTDRRTHVIAEDPLHPDTLYAGTTVGLWKSTDAGVSWIKKSDHNINGLAVDPTDGKTLYLATDSGGIVKSTDGGDTYHAINQGFVNRTITSFELSGTAPRVFFASTTYDGDFGGMFRSDDDAGTWALLATHQRLLDENLISLAVSPANPLLIWAASFDGMLKSSDGGRTWSRPRCFFERPAPPAVRSPRRGAPVRRAALPPLKPFPAPGVRVVAIRYWTHGSTSSLVAATSAGLFLSGDNGVYWRPLPVQPASEPPVLAVYLPPAPSSEALAVLTTSGLFVSADAGASWSRSDLPGRPDTVYDLSLHPSDPQQALAATSSGLFRTTDGGHSWSACRKGLPLNGWFNSVAFDSLDASRVFAAEVDRIYLSEDGGAVWRRLSGDGLDQVWIRALLPGAAPSGGLLVVTKSRGVFVPSTPAVETQVGRSGTSASN